MGGLIKPFLQGTDRAREQCQIRTDQAPHSSPVVRQGYPSLAGLTRSNPLKRGLERTGLPQGSSRPLARTLRWGIGGLAGFRSMT